MSKILDSLKKADNLKNGKHPEGSYISEAVSLSKEPVTKTEALGLSAQKEEKLTLSSSPKTSHTASLVFAALFIMLLAINLKTFSMLRHYIYLNSHSVAKLNQIESALNKNNQQVREFYKHIEKQNNELASLSRQIQDSQELISKLGKKSISQATSLENLTKAKNTLYKKIEELYKEADNRKGSNSGAIEQ